MFQNCNIIYVQLRAEKFTIFAINGEVIMILYFSGTGNSEYAANYIAERIEDEVENLFDRIRREDYSPMESGRPWVVVTPTYGWRIPNVVEMFLRKTDFSGNQEMYFVMTCGQDNGCAGKYLQKMCDGVNLKYMGCAEVVMPENYIAMFEVPDKDEALKIIEDSEKSLDKIIQYLSEGNPFPEKEVHLKDRITSGPANQVFRRFFVRADSFRVTDACVHCGKCEQVCPLENIHYINEKPVWGDKCTHCMACICRCPQEAIEYGRKSVGKERYICPK